MPLTFSPGQEAARQLLAGPQRHTCLVGGARSGKTTLFTRATVLRALKAPKSRHAILRFRTNAARRAISLDTLPKVVNLCWPGVKLREHRSDGFFETPTGSEIWVGGLDDKERVDKILGLEFVTIYLVECSEIAYSSVLTVLTRLAQVVPGLKQRLFCDLNPVGKSHWTNKLFGEQRDPISGEPLRNPEDYARAFLNPIDNRANLTPEFLAALEALPSRQRKRFYEGAYVEEVDGAFWSYELLDEGRCSVEDIPEDRRRRVVVAVDPSGAKDKNDTGKDEIGIVVACKGADGHGYILADLSCRDGPAAWAKIVVKAYHDWKADSVVAEGNFGGEMVRATIQAADVNVPVRIVTASRGKAVRAEPVSMQYAAKRVHHAGKFPTLEEQLCDFSAAGYVGEGSPDRADAAIWAITDLLEITGAETFIAFMAGQIKAAQTGAIDELSDVAPLPWQQTEKPPEDNDLTRAYREALAGFSEQPQVCARCRMPLGDTKITDGVDSWHVGCR